MENKLKNRLGELKISFLEQLCRFEDKPIRLYDYQKEFLFDDATYRIVNKARQLGFSFLIACEAVVESLLMPNNVTLVVSTSEDSAKRVLNYCYKITSGMVIPATMVRASQQEMTYVNGSTIVSLPNNPTTTRGYKADRVYVDEAAHFIKDRDIFQAIQPSISRGGKLTLISTPRGRANLFYEKWYDDLEYSHHRVDYSQCPDTKYQKFVKKMRKTMYDIDFRQEFCFPENTDIITIDGVKNISEIKAGDFVLSHAGRYRKVLKLFQREYVGKLISIKTNGHSKPVICTPEHPILICNDGVNHVFKKAEDINKKDRMIFPRKRLSENKFISESMAVVISWFITEGHFSHNLISFTLNIKETENINNLIAALKRVTSKKVYFFNRDNVCCVCVHDVLLGEFLISMCGSGAYNKKIPLNIISGFENIVLDNLLLGDGCIRNNRISYVTISKTLAYQIQLLANSLGYATSITEPKKINYVDTIKDREVFRHGNFQLRILKERSKNKHLLKIKKHKYDFSVPVKSINTIDFSGTVYNLNVTVDNSYTANGRSVHNCSEFMSDEMAMFPRDLIESCVDQTLHNVDHIETTNPCFMGIDFAKMVDYTVVTIVELTQAKRIVTRYIQELKRLPYESSSPNIPSQFGVINKLFKIFPIQKIKIDSTGVGVKLLEDLERRFGSRVEGVRFGAQDKESLISNLRLVFEKQQLLIPDNDTLISQLLSLEKHTTPSGLPKYKHISGKHDDAVWSLALAVDAATVSNVTIDYEMVGEAQSYAVNKKLFEDRPSIIAV